MLSLPDDVLTAELASIWNAALDAALSPDFASDEGRERYRRNVLLAVRAKVMGLRPDRSHPALGGPVGAVVVCDLCGVSSSASVHLSEAGVDLRAVVVGARVMLTLGVVGRVVRMDTLTLGVVEVDGDHGPERAIFHALNVTEVADVAPGFAREA